MEVILLERISKLGDLGTKVSVKPGFARNYLLPKGKALPATKRNLEHFEQQRAILEKQANERLEKAKGRALILEGLSISIAANAADEGRLFGSVGPHEIIEALQTLGHTVAKNEIALPEGPIRRIGDYEILLHLQGDEVVATIKVSVVPAT